VSDQIAVDESNLREPASKGCGCKAPTPAGAEGGGESVSYVYAVGTVEARFTTLSAEKEFAQVSRQTDTAGKTDQQTFHAVLSQRENRYLLRQLCWVLTVQGLETYLLLPRDAADLDRLVEAIRPVPNPKDIDVIIGMRGPIAPASMCNGLMLPIVAFDQIYSFDRDTLIQELPRPEQAKREQFEPAAEEVFNKIMALTDNAGATDEHRALNYLAVRYPAIYLKTAEQFAADYSLARVEARPSAFSASRRVVDVIFVYTSRHTDFSEKYRIRVDVTEEFPFLVSPMASYFDH
jgi:hypothetical protein